VGVCEKKEKGWVHRRSVSCVPVVSMKKKVYKSEKQVIEGIAPPSASKRRALQNLNKKQAQAVTAIQRPCMEDPSIGFRSCGGTRQVAESERSLPEK